MKNPVSKAAQKRLLKDRGAARLAQKLAGYAFAKDYWASSPLGSA